MRRFSYLLAIVGIIVVGSIIYNRVRADHWRPLPGGGEIRLLAITYGTKNRFQTGGSFLEPLRSRLGPRWSRFFGPIRLIAELPSEEPTLVVWFAARTRRELMLDNKQGLWNRAALSTDNTGHALIGVTVDPAFATERRLLIRVVKKGPPLEFDAGNPHASSAGAPSTSPPVPSGLALVLNVYEAEYATAVPGKPGYITSPYAPEAGVVDVRGFPAGTEVRCPYTQRILLVP